VDGGALDDALEAGGGLRVSGPVGGEAREVLVEEFGEFGAQLVEVDAAGAQHGCGVAVVGQAEEQVFQRGVFVLALGGQAEGAVERLVITRPAVEAGERLGFLPGDLTEKIDPYLLPIWDALRDALGQRRADKYREEGRVEVAPLAFMRGRTLNRAFVIVDEAQNATIPQMRMVLTRLGEGSRMAVTGDPSQTDLRRGEPSGLAHALGILTEEPRIAIHRFTRSDVVRHGLVARIVHAYERDDERRETDRPS
jgi:phosphate starvation-inducible protein PhoH